MADKKIISEKALFKSYINWCFYHLCSFSFDGMQSYGFLRSMIPIVKELYPDDIEEQIKALKRHSVFYNTEPIIGAVVPGIVAGIEENRANGVPVEDNVINGIKTGLMGPLAGIGDSFFQGLLCPILLSLGIGFAANGNPLGPIFYIVTFLAFVMLFTYWIFKRGYKLSVDSINLFLGDNSKALQNAMKVLGLLVVGAIAAQFIALTIVWEIPVEGGDVVSIGAFLDSIFPNLLAWGALFLAWFLLSKKQIKPLYLILGVLVVSIVGVLFGVL